MTGHSDLRSKDNKRFGKPVLKVYSPAIVDYYVLLQNFYQYGDYDISKLPEMAKKFVSLNQHGCRISQVLKIPHYPSVYVMPSTSNTPPFNFACAHPKAAVEGMCPADNRERSVPRGTQVFFSGHPRQRPQVCSMEEATRLLQCAMNDLYKASNDN